MSITSEISRLQQAKSDLAASIENKGVTVPAATTLDGYAALVDNIQTGGGSSLPYDAEVEYLFNSGATQYIDTGIAYDSTVVVVASIKISDAVAGYYVFGILTSVNGTTQRWALNAVSTTKVALHFGTTYNTQANFSRGVFHTITANYRSLSVDGVPTNSSASAFTPEHDVNIYLFARNDDGSAAGFREEYIGYFKIYKGGNLVRDFIPVRNNGVGYMYDKVSAQLFGNAGTGSFTLGPDVT